PAGPMTSGLPNKEKARIRQLYAEGKATREELLDAEAASYHSPGTCTFYGTANSNQLVVEVMGLHLPGATFVHPGTPLRRALTEHAARRIVDIAKGDQYTPLAHVIDERSIVNGLVALLATGGSANHTLHLVAVAAAAGITLTWDEDRKSTRLNSSHVKISYAVFCLKKKNTKNERRNLLLGVERTACQALVGGEAVVRIDTSFGRYREKGRVWGTQAHRACRRAATTH